MVAPRAWTHAAPTLLASAAACCGARFCASPTRNPAHHESPAPRVSTTVIPGTAGTSIGACPASATQQPSLPTLITMFSIGFTARQAASCSAIVVFPLSWRSSSTEGTNQSRCGQCRSQATPACRARVHHGVKHGHHTALSSPRHKTPARGPAPSRAWEKLQARDMEEACARECVPVHILCA